MVLTSARILAHECTQHLQLKGYGFRGFPKIRGTLLGFPIIRTVIFLGLYWGPLILGYGFRGTKSSASGGLGLRHRATDSTQKFTDYANLLRLWVLGALRYPDGRALGTV